MASARDLMTPSPHTIGASQTVAEASRRMRQAHVRHLPVLEGAHVVGMLSERDARLVDSVAGEKTCLVSDVMTPEPYVVQAGADLKEIVETMAERKLGSAIVVDGAKVVGIFTTTDALHLLLRHLVIDELRGI
jgi:acetoin utilization protein AcuB